MIKEDALTAQAQIYDEIDEALIRVRAQARVPRSGTFRDTDNLKRRFAQAVCNQLLQPLLKVGVASFERSSPRVSVFKGTLNGISFDSSQGTVRVSLKKWFGLLARFCAHWWICLWNVCRSPAQEGDTLFWEPSGKTVHGEITPLREGRVVIGAHPECNLVRTHIRSVSESLHFLRLHLKMALEFFRHAVFVPEWTLLEKDYAGAAPLLFLNNRGALKNAVLTNSSFNEQVLALSDRGVRAFKTHLVWYSSNVKGTFHLKNTQTSEIRYPLFPPFRYVFSDVSWYWTQGHADWFLRHQGSHDARVIGPILFYGREYNKESNRDVDLRVPRRVPGREIVISLFDVTPVSSEWDRDYGLLYNYYSPELLRSFVKDTIDAVAQVSSELKRDWRVVLKHKRGVESIHDPGYIAQIEAWTRELPGFTIMHADVNLYDLIEQSDCAVVIPYSSPAFVASHVGRPAIFYDPSELLIPFADAAPGVMMCQGAENLVTTLRHALK